VEQSSDLKPNPDTRRLAGCLFFFSFSCRGGVIRKPTGLPRGGSARKETAVPGLDGEDEAGFGVELTESAWQVTDSRDPSTARPRANSKERAWRRSAQGDRWRHSARKRTAWESRAVKRSFALLRISPGGSDAAKTAQLRLRAVERRQRKGLGSAPLRVDRWRHSGRKQCTETNSLGILRCQEILPLRPTQGQDFAWRLRRRQNGSRCTTSQLIRTMKCASISHASGREQGEFIENKANSERLVLGT